MAKSYYKLKDQGTTFFDMTQGLGVVADRVALLENTSKVRQAATDGVLIKLDPAEGKAKYNNQQTKLEKAGLIEESKPLAEGVDGDGSNVAKTLEDDADLDDDDAGKSGEAPNAASGSKKATRR